MSSWKIFLPLVMVLVVLSSGCVIQTSTGGGSGLVIQNFEADSSKAYPGEEVRFMLRLQNTGTVPAKIEEIEINKVNGWETTLESCSALEGSEVPAGISVNCRWKMVAPENSGGIPMKYEPTARVTYSYRSSTVRSIKIGPSRELEKVENVESLQSTSVTTGGPVSIQIVTKNPITITRGQVTFPVKFIVSNSGGGTVCNGKCSRETWNRLTLKLESEGISMEECQEKEFVLYKGQSNSFVCSASASPPEEGYLETTLHAWSEYGYIVEKSITFTVGSRSMEI